MNSLFKISLKTVFFLGSFCLLSWNKPIQNGTNHQDFNLDGQTDLLFQNTQTGMIQAWFMSGTDRAGFNNIKEQSNQQTHYITSPWSVVGTARIDNDNRTDLILHNKVTGVVQAWFMSGTDRKGYNEFKEMGSGVLTKTSADWIFVDAGDFDRDNQDDLLWYNTRSGELQVWFMSGTDRKGYDYIKEQSTQQRHALSSEWQPKVCGDINLDGKTDIVIQNKTTGEIQAWFMDGAARTGYNSVKEQQSKIYAGKTWSLKSIGKINNDGNPDLIFHDAATGEMQVWFMSGTDRVGYNSVKEQSNQNVHYIKYPWRLVR